MQGGEQVAVKVPQRKDRSAPHTELGRLMHLSGHPNIMPIKGVVYGEGQPCIVMELYKKGSLDDYILPENHQYRKHFGSPRHLLDTCASIADAVAFMHSLDIVHGDLRHAGTATSRRHASGGRTAWRGRTSPIRATPLCVVRSRSGWLMMTHAARVCTTVSSSGPVARGTR